MPLDILRTYVRQSVLLDEQRRSGMLAALDALDDVQREKLISLFESEPRIIETIAARAVQKAMREGDDAFLDVLDDMIDDAQKILPRAAESVSSADALQRAESALENDLSAL